MTALALFALYLAAVFGLIAWMIRLAWTGRDPWRDQ